MADIRKLLQQIASEESKLQDSQFLAPCVKGGSVRTSITQIIYTFTPEPRDFSGWGIFQAVNSRKAAYIEEPSLPQLDAYLQLFPALRMRLVSPLKEQTWLAYPSNEADMRQRCGFVEPIAVHLVAEGEQFAPILARLQGRTAWFERVDRRAEPQPTEKLAECLRKEKPTQEIRFPGMTPEMRTIYNLAWQQSIGFRQREQHRQEVRKERKKKSDQLDAETRLNRALRQGGGQMRSFRDRGEFWQVEWQTQDGQRHTSAIGKEDLTVMGAGICLSGRDRDFDLQSLVGVVEGVW